MRKFLFYFSFIFSIICLGYANPVDALIIGDPEVTGIEYVSDSSVKILYKTNNTNTDYKVQIYNMTNGKYYTNTIPSDSYTLTGLTTEKTYNIILRVYYKTTVSNWSKPISATPKEGVPVINSVTAGDKQLTLNYNANGSPKEIEIYISNIKKSVKTSNLSTATLTGLTNGTTYTFMMRGCYDSGKCGGWSTSKSGVPKATAAPVTPTPAPTTPEVDKTVIPTFSSITVGSKKLILKYKTSGNPTGIEIKNVTTGNSVKTTNLTTKTMTGLTNDKKYKFKIRNYFSDGSTGGWSSTKSATPRTAGKRIKLMAEKLVWPSGTSSSKYSYSSGSPTSACKTAMNKWGYDTKVKWSDCSYFVNTVVRESGVDTTFKAFNGSKAYTLENTTSYPDRWKIVYKGKKIAKSNLIAGDVIRYDKKSARHTVIYIGDNKIAEAGKKIRFARITSYSGKMDDSSIKFSTLQVLRAQD